MRQEGSACLCMLDGARVLAQGFSFHINRADHCDTMNY